MNTREGCLSSPVANIVPSPHPEPGLIMAFVERQRQLLRTGEFSDFIINVSGREFKVHRSIICPQSTVLHRICAGNFKEAAEGGGVLPEADADVFERILDFIYTGEYKLGVNNLHLAPQDHIDVSGSQDSLNLDEGDDSVLSNQQSEELMIHTEVYLLAKYLDIGELMEHAKEEFTRVVKQSFRADAFVEPFARVFSHGDDGGDGLRAQILRLSLENSEHLPKDGELTRLLLEHEPVAWNLLLRREEEHSRQTNENLLVRRVLEQTLEALQGTIQTLRQREEELTTDRDRILAVLEKHDRCRNCDKEFAAYVDKYEHGIVRCKSCRCRHYLER